MGKTKTEFIMQVGTSDLPTLLKQANFYDANGQLMTFTQVEHRLWQLSRTAIIKLAFNREKTAMLVYSGFEFQEVRKFRIDPFVGIIPSPNITHPWYSPVALINQNFN